MAPKNKAPKDVDREVAAYTNIRPKLEVFTNKLKLLLEELLSKEGIKVQSTEHRTKSTESFKEKIGRPGKNYSAPLNQLTDLSGHRIIVYYQDDIQKVSNLIKNVFKVDKDASLDKASKLAPNEFGYLSTHYIVSLKRPRSSLQEWKEYANFKAEIQVRTVLQHAWAAIEHSLQYKNDIDIPTQFRRRLFRLSGLLELADQEFSTLRSAQIDLRQEARQSAGKPRSALEINAITVNAYVEQSDLIRRYKSLAKRLGYKFDNSEKGKSYTSDVVQLALRGVHTIGELDHKLRDAEPAFDTYLRTLISNFRKALSDTWVITDVFLLLLLCIQAFRKHTSAEELTKSGWDSLIAKVVMHAATMRRKQS